MMKTLKVLQVVAIAFAFIYIVVSGAARFDAPFWLVAAVMLGPVAIWLYAPMFSGRTSQLKDDENGCPPSLLDLLLEQTPTARLPAAERERLAAERRAVRIARMPPSSRGD